MNRHLRAAAFLVVPALAAVPCGTAAQRPPADTVWRYQAPANLERLRNCTAAELLFTTKSALVALDAATGKRLWQLDDLPSLDWGLFFPCDAKTGLSYRGNKITAFDLVSGRQRWDAAALPPFLEIRGFVALPDDDLLLLFLRTAASDRSLLTMRLSSGERLWQRDDLFEQPPAFAAHGGVSDLAEFQAFILGGDTALFLYVSPDGPMRVDLRTGATVWKGRALAGPRLPGLDQYAGMRLLDSTLVVPREKGLVALDARDGHVRWQAPALLPRRATRLVAVPAGLLVRAGGDYVAVLDPATGTPRWQPPLTARTDGAAYEIVGNRYFFVSRDRVLVANLETGDTTGHDKLSFKDAESAWDMTRSGDGFVVASRQNLFALDGEGVLRYQRYYHAPGASFFQVMGGMNPNATFGSAVVTDEYAFFVTNTPDSAGHTGNSLVRVALADGREMGRVWFREKSPTYWPDLARDQLLLLADPKTLVAVRFSPPR
jgi:outer membrane protein assembly factor BamB